jgi:hypothetical protein
MAVGKNDRPNLSVEHLGRMNLLLKLLLCCIRVLWSGRVSMYITICVFSCSLFMNMSCIDSRLQPIVALALLMILSSLLIS